MVGDKLEVFTLHSKGEKNGMPFSPSSIPLSTLETIVSNVPAFVIGSGVQGAKKNDIRDAMSVSIADGSLSVGVALPMALATVLNASSFPLDMSAFAAGRPNEVKDAVRLEAARILKTNLMREGAKSIGFSSRAAGIVEFNIVEKNNV